jgi:hypothetical protein
MPRKVPAIKLTVDGPPALDQPRRGQRRVEWLKGGGRATARGARSERLTARPLLRIGLFGERTLRRLDSWLQVGHVVHLD